jgi:hypothetical protein
MQWITREHPKIDRIACPWLILRFIDAHAQLHYVPAERVVAMAKETGATPYDIPGATFPDDREMLRHGLVVYDALYACCAKLQYETHAWPPAGYSLAS